MFETFAKLYQANLSTPIGFSRLIHSVIGTGTNLMALLRFAARTYPSEIAVIDHGRAITYKDLHQETEQLVLNLHEKYSFQSGTKVALLCRNHISLVKSLFALSQLGVDTYLLNIEMNAKQFNQLIQQHDFDCLIYDIEVWEMVRQSDFDERTILSEHLTFDAIDQLSIQTSKNKVRLKKQKTGKLVILTGGTTGAFKTAVRKPSLSNFLNPFFALLKELDLATYRSTYIATPIYHGFGLAALLISITLGAKIVLTRRFNIQTATTLLLQHKVQVLVLVPLMLNRLLERGKLELLYTKVVLSGGAPLNPALIQKTFDTLKYGLANLYGTSEAGFCILATPDDLKKHPNTIGKAINGVQVKLLDDTKQEVPLGEIGQLCIQSSWTMNNSTDQSIPTGDLAYVNEEGYYFLCGRIDDRIVSGGENVYPVELEHILWQHEAIQQVAVIGIPDKEFGQGLKAFVQLKPEQKLDQPALKAWIKKRAARYQNPKEIVFMDNIPTTSLGKIDKKKL